MLNPDGIIDVPLKPTGFHMNALTGWELVLLSPGVGTASYHGRTGCLTVLPDSFGAESAPIDFDFVGNTLTETGISTALRRQSPPSSYHTVVSQ